VPANPTNHVDLVNTHVDENSAGGISEHWSGRAVIPLTRVNDEKTAECSRIDPRFQVSERRNKSAPISDLESNPRIANYAGYFGRIINRQTSGFLAQNGQSRCGQSSHCIDVKRARSGNEVSVDASGCDKSVDRIVGYESL
jgi:hypothetical protein